MSSGRVIVCGSRDGIVPHDLVARALSAFDRDRFPLTHIVVGSNRGVDREAAQWALKYERTMTIVSAEWATHGKAAGPARNERMGSEFRPEAVLAFPGGPGTANMRAIAERLWLPLWSCDVRGEHWQWRFASSQALGCRGVERR